MKKSLLMLSLLNALLFVSISLKTQAQDYQINFTGSGESSTVDSVKVENLTQCKSLHILGGDILHLSENLGMSDLNTTEPKFLKIFPNPCQGVCSLEFESSESSEFTISLCSLDGKLLFRKQEVLMKGYHSYLLRGISNGAFCIKVESDKYSSVEKILCNNNSSAGTAIILTKIIAGSKKPVKLKSSHSTVNMQYTNGDILKFTGKSGTYRTVYMLVPTQSLTIDFIFSGCFDANNNNYPVVQIGTQLWMAENLKTTRYRNGDMIPNIAGNPAWSNLTSGAYCWYENDSLANAPVYGALYNWYSTTDSRNLAPQGWHVPSDAEWTTLSTWLGGQNIAGGKLKDSCSTLWNDPNTGASNETGFTALPGGYRFLDGTFDENRNWAVWWCSTSSSINSAPTRAAFKDEAGLGRDISNKKDGFSVRCIKD